jgi:hypothetical protein
MTFADGKLIFKQSSNTQRSQAFFRWGSRELFSSNFNLKSSKPTLVWSTCAISITCDKSITFFHFASNIKYLKSIFSVFKAISINSFMFYTKISKKKCKKFFPKSFYEHLKKFIRFSTFFFAGRRWRRQTTFGGFECIFLQVLSPSTGIQIFR